MQKEFDECVENGGKVRTIKRDGKIRSICSLDGKHYTGKIEKEKKEKK